MKSLLNLHLAALQDAGRFCSTNTERDAARLISRYEDEGQSFLTITLPILAKALEKGLDSGQWPRQSVSNFRHRRGLPLLLRGFLTRIFDEDGQLRDEPDVNSIWAVRQVCYLTHKISTPPTAERHQAALENFITTDSQIPNSLSRLTPEDWSQFIRTATRLFDREFSELDALVASFDLIPRHGPGAVAEKLNHERRWDFGYWTERLEGVFPSWRYRSNLPTSLHPCPVPMEQEIPVRVIAVPKTQSTPRIIAIEPSTVQYAQQGLKREMYRVIEQGPLGKVLGFTDQTRNREMAKSASADQTMATLDLSEASDRVSLSIVENLFSRWPHLLDYVLAVRSVRADVEGVVIPLNKYASMGSALTFPVEALVFTTLAVMGIESGRGKRLNLRQLPEVLSVYGDDIICPVDTVASVIDHLERFGAKVNRNKSFWTGKFRESCGADFYDGVDVSVVRLRAELPSSRKDATSIGRTTDFRNRCYSAGLWSVVKHCDAVLDAVLPLRSSFVLEGSASSLGVLAKDTVLPTPWKGIRWDPNLQRWTRRFHRLIERSNEYSVDDEAGLLKWFQEAASRDVVLPEDPYQGQERPHAFSIYMRGVEHLPKSSTGRKACGTSL